MFFAYLTIVTLIALFCDVTFKIRYLLSMIFLMFGVVQWHGINIFLLLKIHMNVYLILIAIDSYGICLWVFECQCIKDWNVASCNNMKIWNATWHHTHCRSSSLPFIVCILYFPFWIWSHLFMNHKCCECFAFFQKLVF